MRVSKHSNHANIAGALSGSLRSGDVENLDFMAPAATYNAVKALALAAEFIKPQGIKPVIEVKSFKTPVGKHEEEKTVYRFVVHPVPIAEENDDE